MRGSDILSMLQLTQTSPELKSDQKNNRGNIAEWMKY